MEENKTPDLRNFTQVWQRVTAPDDGAAQHTQERARLGAFMAREHQRRQHYAYLAAGGGGSQTLRRMAAAAGERLRLLQLEHYLLCGDSCPLPPAEEKLPRGLSGLRRLYWDEEQSQRDYLTAAATSTGTCQALYARLAEDCRLRAKQLRELMGKALG